MPEELNVAKSNVIALVFYQADATASQAGVELDVAGEATAGDAKYVPSPWSGDIVGISVAAEAARTAGTLTVQPSVDGSALGPTAALNATDTQYKTGSARKRQYPFDAAARLGAIVTTDAAWAAGVTPSIVVTVFANISDP